MIRMAAVVAICAAGMAAAVTGGWMASADGQPGLSAERSFLTPRIDGRRVDIRLSAGGPGDPAITAGHFCRAQGFDSVVGFSIQPAAATRTIGDLEIQSAPDGTLRAFYAIRCAHDGAGAGVAQG